MTKYLGTERILIRSGNVLTMDPKLGDFDSADVLIENGLITAVGPSLPVTDARIIEASEYFVLPGFVDTHRHTWQSVLRHIVSDWTLGQYFTGIHFGMSKLFRPEDTYAGNLLGVTEALDSGITTLLDWSHNLETPAHSDAAIQALFDSGSRAIFAHGGGATMWQVPSALAHDRDALRVKEQYFSSDDQLVTMAFAARGPQFAPGGTTVADWALARELGTRITVHVGDGAWGLSRPVAWLRDHGFTGSDVTYVHCNMLADDEIQMIADTGGTASLAPDGEMGAGHGWPATGRLLDVGVRPSLSIDSVTASPGDMFHVMKTTLTTQRAVDNAAEAHGGNSDSLRLSCWDVLEFGTLRGAVATGLDDIIGSLTPGKQADIVLIRADGLGATPRNNPYGSLVYNAHAGMVDTVLVAGRVVKQDGKLLDIDVDKVKALAIATNEYLFEQAAKDPTMAGAQRGGRWFPKAAQA